MATVTEPGPGRSAPLEVVRAAYGAFAARDVDGLLRLLGPDVEWGEPDNPLIPSAGTRHGIAGVVDWLRIGNETETIVAFEPRQFLVTGDEIAVVGHTKVVAKPTGKAYETDFVHLVTVADGRIVRFRRVLRHVRGGRGLPLVRAGRRPGPDHAGPTGPPQAAVRP